MARGLSWTRWPAALGGLALALGAVLLVANLAVETITPGHPIKLAPGLYGVTPPLHPPPLSPQTVLSGQIRRFYGPTIGTHLPLYPAAVRLRNQVEYSLFGLAGVPNVVVGRGGQLIERAYIEEYCHRDLAQFRPLAEAWAQRLRQMQDDTERRGKIFLYVITPSKVAQYPQYLPPGTPCPAPEADRTGLIPTWMQILRHNGVHVVDTTAVLSVAHGAYPFALWPLGGTHWNAVGSALGAQAVQAALAAQRPDGAFPPFTFTWHMTSPPRGQDRDLALLMNLEQRLDTYAVPALSVAWGHAACRPENITIVGGSFMLAIAGLLTQGPCHPHIVEYEYWKSYHVTWPGTEAKAGPVDDTAARARDVMDADVLLYEENEQIAARSNHGPALYDFLARQPGWRD